MAKSRTKRTTLSRYEKLVVSIERYQRKFEKADKTAKRCLLMLAKLERQRRSAAKRQAAKEREVADDLVISAQLSRSKEVDPTTQLGMLGPAPGFDQHGNRIPDDQAKPAAKRRSTKNKIAKELGRLPG